MIIDIIYWYVYGYTVVYLYRLERRSIWFTSRAS